MILDVCFAVYDPDGTYSRNVGIAMESIFEHTKQNVRIHLLHDDTLSDDNKDKFDQLVKTAGQTIEYHLLHLPATWMKMETANNFSPGTLYRLMLPELLDESITKAIYFDADILVTCDIAELYRLMEKETASVLVVKGPDLTYFSPHSRSLFTTGVLDEATYFNAGVMVFNLTKVREKYDIKNEALAFFKKYPKCSFADQDAYNYIFLHDKKLIDGKYNFQSLYHRGEGTLIDGIYHFAGDMIRPVPEEAFEELYFETWKHTPWGSASALQEYYVLEIQKRQMQVKAWRTMWLATRKNAIILFGARSVLTRKCIDLLKLDPQKDMAMDNAPSLWGTTSFGLEVKSPSYLKTQEARGAYVIILSNLHYPEIKRQMEEEFGLKQGKDFIDGRMLLEHVKFFADK